MRISRYGGLHQRLNRVGNSSQSIIPEAAARTASAVHTGGLPRASAMLVIISLATISLLRVNCFNLPTLVDAMIRIPRSLGGFQMFSQVLSSKTLTHLFGLGPQITVLPSWHVTSDGPAAYFQPLLPIPFPPV